MKLKLLFVSFCFVGIANAQTESRVEKKFQHFENGELVEDRYYLEENGQVLQGQDFEMPKNALGNSNMEAKMAEMTQRMNEMQQKMEQRMTEMENRMSEMRQRSERLMEMGVEE